MIYVRRLLLENVKNIRDIGGYATRDRRATSFGKFIRSGVVTKLSKEDVEYLLDYGVRTIIDLREQREVNSKPNSFSNNSLVKYYNIPIANANRNMRAKDISAWIALEGTSSYLRIANNYRAIKLVFRAMVENIEGITLFNCALGRDRTGIIAALLLMLADVSPDDIEIDYSISYTTIRKLIKIEKKEDYDLPNHLLRINQLMNYIIIKFGSIFDYFLTIGLTSEEIYKLRDKLIQ